MNDRIEIKKLNEADLNDFIELIRVFEDVFEMENFIIPDNDYLQKLLAKENFFVFAATLENAVVGGLTCHTLQQYYSKLPLVYIYDLAVKTELQRQGIGTNLIAKVNEYCKESGMEEVFVQADRIDDYAVDFYRKTGATEEDVVHFYYPLNKMN